MSTPCAIFRSFPGMFLEVSQIWWIRTIRIQIGKKYWDLETCRKSDFLNKRRTKKSLFFKNEFHWRFFLKSNLHIFVAIFGEIPCRFVKGQMILKGLLVSSNSPRKWMIEFVFTTTTNLGFLGEFEETKKSFRNYLTFILTLQFRMIQWSQI